jgi:hypothetical protein
MCAYDALIGAPEATLIDVAVLGTFDVVVTNSWGVYDPIDDVPPGSYIANPKHAFNIASACSFAPAPM